MNRRRFIKMLRPLKKLRSSKTLQQKFHPEIFRPQKLLWTNSQKKAPNKAQSPMSQVLERPFLALVQPLKRQQHR